jgi:hypothetical protein
VALARVARQRRARRRSAVDGLLRPCRRQSIGERGRARAGDVALGRLVGAAPAAVSARRRRDLRGAAAAPRGDRRGGLSARRRRTRARAACSNNSTRARTRTAAGTRCVSPRARPAAPFGPEVLRGMRREAHSGAMTRARRANRLAVRSAGARASASCSDSSDASPAPIPTKSTRWPPPRTAWPMRLHRALFTSCRRRSGSAS